jgi:hypothetical protein
MCFSNSFCADKTGAYVIKFWPKLCGMDTYFSQFRIVVNGLVVGVGIAKIGAAFVVAVTKGV